METNKNEAVYGYVPLSEEERQTKKENNFIYLMALANAEKLNPEKDWDNERLIGLLKKIATSYTDSHHRENLVFYLCGNDSED